MRGAAIAAGGPGQRHAGVPVPPSQDRGNGVTGEWPLQDFIELGALTGAVPSARLHSRHVLWEWGQARLSESVELVVCELMTNAVAASGLAELVLPVRLWLLSDKTRVLILVWDANAQPPVRFNSGDEDEGGRGLVLVEAVSKE
jgi:anti-sigma regulatory factor (Ser/Thr protein kinase)